MIYWLVLITILFIPRCAPQQEIVSIVTTPTCLQVDPFALANHSDIPDGADRYLDCTDTQDSNGNPLRVNLTTIVLRLVASRYSNSEFDVNLTVVPSIGSGDVFNDAQKCLGLDGNQGDPTDCILSQPTSIRIKSTKYVFYYKLNYINEIVPQYCYVNRFDIQPTSTVHLPGSDFSNSISLTTGCDSTIKVKSCASGGDCDDWMSDFEDPAGLSKGILPDGRTSDQFFYGQPDPNKNGEDKIKDRIASDTCRYTALSYDTVRKGYVPPNLQSIKFAPSQFPVDFFDTVTSMPISDPEPEPLSSKVNVAYGNVLQSLLCSGFTCSGMYGGLCFNRSETGETVPFADAFTAINTTGKHKKGTPIQGPAHGTLEMFSLGPECFLYKIDEVPGVAATIEIEVGTDNCTLIDGCEVQSETLVINDLMNYQRVHSINSYLGARVIQPETSNGYLGPALGGYIIQCGRNTRPDDGQSRRVDDIQVPKKKTRHLNLEMPSFSDYSVPPAYDLDGSSFNKTRLEELYYSPFVDMVSRWRPDNQTTDVTYNPWLDIIMKDGERNETDRFSQTGRYYPVGRILNDARNPDEVGDANAMWYYLGIGQTTKLHRGCNGLASTDLIWNTNFQAGSSPSSHNGQEQCFMNPYACTPGVTDQSPGNRSIPGCLASTVFNIKQQYEDVTSVGYDVGNDPTNPYNIEERKILIDDIARKSMPKYYTPEAPNYWTTVLPDGLGTVLMFDPTGSTYPRSSLAIEIAIDLTGNFVRYQSTVPGGKILSTSCENATENTISTGWILVENIGSIPGTYLLTMDCKDEVIEFEDGTLLSGEINPGNSSFVYFQFSSEINPEELDSGACQVNLFPAEGDAFVILDSVLFTCSGQQPFAPPPPPINQSDPLPPGEETCPNWCDFECYAAYKGGATNAPCFVVLVILAVFIVALALGAAVSFAYTKWKMNHLVQDYDDMIRDLETESKQPNVKK